MLFQKQLNNGAEAQPPTVGDRRKLIFHVAIVVPLNKLRVIRLLLARRVGELHFTPTIGVPVKPKYAAARCAPLAA